MRTIILSITMIMLSFYQSAQAQQADTLSIRQQRIVAIAATTAQGDLENLKTSLARGLDNGMTVNEIKEVLVHAYAYCGFPRSLRALQTFMEVLDERKAQGITDAVGREASAVTDRRDKYTRGAELLEKLSGAPADAPKSRVQGVFQPKSEAAPGKGQEKGTLRLKSSGELAPAAK